jgi:hypothetical protein
MSSKHVRSAAGLLGALVLGLLGGPLEAAVTCASGGTCTQTLELRPGWNAIYLQVAPEEDAPARVFEAMLGGTGPRVTSVWTWLPRRARVEFVQNPDTEDFLSDPGWLRFFPPLSERAFLTSLFAMPGNRAYLVKVEGLPAGQTVPLAITGRPLVPRPDWTPDSFNLVGFHVDPASPPTFSDFFAASPAHQEGNFYRLGDDGLSWQPVAPAADRVEPGRAYWVWCEGGSDYTGPLKVTMDQLDRLAYGTNLESFTLRLGNPTGSQRPVTAAMAGDGTPMYYRNPDPAAADRWLPLPFATDISAGDDERIRIGIKRSAFQAGEYADTLEILQEGGSRWLVPVTASAPEVKGLWIGTVTIEQVSQAQNYRHDCDEDGKNPGAAGNHELCLDDHGLPIGDAGDTLSPVSEPFEYRILLHEDGAGQVRLLKEVIQMWQPGTDTQPGRHVLLTDDTLIPRYQGVALRDGRAVGRRLSTVAYDLPGQSLLMAGSFGGTLTTTLVLEPGAPSNPFRHKYHPDHNNLSADYRSPRAEAYRVERVLTLTFDLGDGGELGAGYADAGGTYTEVVTGLHKNDIVATGRFELRHAAATDVLNQ